jgi:hypothetical protein
MKGRRRKSKRMVGINEIDGEKKRRGRGNIGICQPNAKE